MKHTTIINIISIFFLGYACYCILNIFYDHGYEMGKIDEQLEHFQKLRKFDD
jgi:hypothetical protein